MANLALVRREPSGRTEWVFAERPEGAPPMAAMCGALWSIEETGRIAGADLEKYWCNALLY